MRCGVVGCAGLEACDGYFVMDFVVGIRRLDMLSWLRWCGVSRERRGVRRLALRSRLRGYGRRGVLVGVAGALE